MEMKKLSAKDIAKYFLTFTDEDAGDTISNLKLQKLLYYAQGFFLAIYDKKLFDDKIFAWKHGPVVDTVYHEYKRYGANGIPVEEIKLEEYRKEVLELLDNIYEIYGQFSPWKLRELTQEETPFLQTKLNEEITQDKLMKFFKTRVE